MKKLIISLFLLVLIFPKFTFAQGVATEGVVTNIIEENGNYQKLEITSKNGSQIIENGLYESSQNVRYKVNDNVVVTDGQITDFVRRPSLYLLFILFVVSTILIAGKWGLTSILGMGYSFYVIFKFILPMIIKGYDPVITAIIGSIFIIPVTFSLSHGVNRKTINAIVGTLIAMVVVGLLSALFVNISKLTGFAF